MLFLYWRSNAEPWLATSYLGDHYKKATGLRNMIKLFCSEEDVVTWLRKVNQVVKLQNVDNVAALIPLFLEDDALAIYLELSKWDQKDVDIIRTRLKQAFAEGLYEAYEKLKSVWWIGESVDVYANKIKWQVELVGYRGYGTEITARMVFITGFPEEIAQKLQHFLEKMEVSNLILTAKR